MRYWDASALVPLLVEEKRTGAMLTLLRKDVEIVTWWGSRTECVSALSRRQREGTITPTDCQSSIRILDELSAGWTEVNPSAEVRKRAERLLRVHPLRMADAFQLAAALIIADGEPESLPFVSSDVRLNTTALAEGLAVVIQP